MALECGREDAGYGPESDRNLQGVKNSTTMVCQLLDENKKGKLWEGDPKDVKEIGSVLGLSWAIVN
jgi:hypothetical protein